MASEFMQHPWPGSTRTTDNSGHNWLPSPPSSPSINSSSPAYIQQPPVDRKYNYSPEDEEATLTSAALHMESTWSRSTWESPGLEVAPEDCGKEVVQQQEAVPEPDYPVESYRGTYPGQEGEDEKKPPKRTKRGFLVALIIGIVVILALALGLGLGLGLKKHKSPHSTIPNYYSTTGAFNGSGIAIASESFAGTNYGTIVLYFQHWTGSLRSLVLEPDGSWQGGDVSTIVATDAKNATPISAVSYAMDGISTWHIFYISTTNTLREKVNSNATNLWVDGPLSALNLQAMDDPNVGLQACWYGSFYGDANYSHSPIPGTGSNTTSPDSVVGMHLWYGTSGTTVQEYEWTFGTGVWVEQGVFVGNGHAGVACYSWGPGSVSYTMLSNLDSTTRIMWKDLNPNATSTPIHPLGTWVNTSITALPSAQNTSLGYTNFFYLQSPSLTISGYNVSFAAEDTSIVTTDNFTIGIDKALPGSHMSLTALPNRSGGDSLLVFDQVVGNDVMEFVRDIEGGQWTESWLPIPDT